MDRWREYPVLRVTLVSLVAGFCLIVAGLAGSRATPLLVVGLFALAAAAHVAVSAIEERDLLAFDHHRYAADLPLAPLVAAVATLAFLGATPGEVQAVGGGLGLLGMGQYFLRPVYHALYRAVAWLASV
jgi:hypothetical protein